MKIILNECIKIMGIFSFIRGKSRVAIGGNDDVVSGAFF